MPVSHRISDPEAVTPVFDLTRAQLWPILQAVAAEPVTDFSLAIERSLQGYEGGSGDKLIPTVTFSMPGGKTRQVTLFVKRSWLKGCSEAVHYQHLALQGFPTPRLYGALWSPENEEIIFLEYLTETGFRVHEVSDWRQFFSLMARFNAMTITTDYAAFLPRRRFVENLTADRIVASVRAAFEGARSGELGEELADLCQDADQQMPVILGRMRALGQEIDQLPTGLIHADFLLDQVGWRPGREEMLLFDIHMNCIASRFYDAAVVFGETDLSRPPSRVDPVRVCLHKDGTGADPPCPRDHVAPLRTPLAEYYLAEYARWGGPSVSLQQFEQECSLLCLAYNIGILSHGRGRTHRWQEEGDDNPEEARRCYAKHLHQVFSCLLAQGRESGSSSHSR